MPPESGKMPPPAPESGFGFGIGFRFRFDLVPVPVRRTTLVQVRDLDLVGCSQPTSLAKLSSSREQGHSLPAAYGFSSTLPHSTSLVATACVADDSAQHTDL
jgi:hypothetical protein